MRIFLTIILFFFLLIPINPAQAADPYYIVIFTSENCPYCEQTKNFFNIVKQSQYPNMEIVVFPVDTNVEYYNQFKYYAAAYGIDDSRVPVTLIGENAIVGFQPEEFRTALNNCEQNGCALPQEFVQEQQIENPSEKTSTSIFDNRVTTAWLIFALLVTGGIIVLYMRKS